MTHPVTSAFAATSPASGTAGVRSETVRTDTALMRAKSKSSRSVRDTRSIWLMITWMPLACAWSAPA